MINFCTKLLIQIALIEDVGPGDLTTEATIPLESTAGATIIAREPLVVCGQEVVAAVFDEVRERYGLAAEYQAVQPDGAAVENAAVIGRVHGSLRAILIAERTALNFLQRLSGIATHTRNTRAQCGDKLKLLDTRKTTPGYRALEKHAVQIGGGDNHRIGLYDQVLIKNNHIDALGGDIAESIRRARAHAPLNTIVEVEVRNLAELRAAISETPDCILLDNMTPAELTEAVLLVRKSSKGAHILLEASGGITREKIAAIEKSGVDAVSMGMLTHSAPSMDISLRYESAPKS